MTNEERRRVLNRARKLAAAYAEEADKQFHLSSEDGPEAILATMWATVANAMKDGSPEHDGPDGAPSLITHVHSEGTLTR